MKLRRRRITSSNLPKVGELLVSEHDEVGLVLYYSAGWVKMLFEDNTVLWSDVKCWKKAG